MDFKGTQYLFWGISFSSVEKNRVSNEKNSAQRFISFTFHADQGTDNSKRDCRGHVRLFINAVLFLFTCMNILYEIVFENCLC